MATITTTFDVTIKENETKNAFHARAAAIDVVKRSKKNAVKFTEEQHSIAREFYDMVVAAYEWSRVFSPNNREGFIAIKVAAPKKQDKISQRVRDLDMLAAKSGIKLVESGNNIIYRLFA